MQNWPALPGNMLLKIYVPRSELLRVRECLNELRFEQAFAIHNWTVGVFGTDNPSIEAHTQQEQKRIQRESEGDVFARAFVGDSDLLMDCAWSMCIAISKDYFRSVFHRAVSKHWKLNQEVDKFINCLRVVLDNSKTPAVVGAWEDEW